MLYHVVYENAPRDFDVIYDNRVKAEAKRLLRELKAEAEGTDNGKFKIIPAN